MADPRNTITPRNFNNGSKWLSKKNLSLFQKMYLDIEAVNPKVTECDILDLMFLSVENHGGIKQVLKASLEHQHRSLSLVE